MNYGVKNISLPDRIGAMLKRKPDLDIVFQGANGKDAHTFIELTKGYTAIISLADEDLKQFNWTASETGDHVYALRRDPETRKPILMHRVIMERILGRPLKPEEIVDHQIGDGTNNRRENLRLTDASRNAANTRKRKKNNNGDAPSSIYKGVYFNKSKKKWCAQINIDGKRTNLGYFNDEEEAAKEYDKAAIIQYGIHQKINFINEDYAFPEHKQNRSARRKPRPSIPNDHSS